MNSLTIAQTLNAYIKSGRLAPNRRFPIDGHLFQLEPRHIRTSIKGVTILVFTNKSHGLKIKAAIQLVKRPDGGYHGFDHVKTVSVAAAAKAAEEKRFKAMI